MAGIKIINFSKRMKPIVSFCEGLVAQTELSDQFNIEIIRFDISSIDYVKDTVVLDLYFNERHPIQEILELDPSNHPAER